MVELENKNMLQGLNFQLVIDRLPATTYFSKDVTLPAMTIGVSEEPSPFTVIKYPGDHIDFEELMVTFDVDQDMTNYIELQRWMLEIAPPDNFSQYKKDKDLNMSDATLLIMDNNFNTFKNGRVKFRDLWPFSLSSIMWSISQNNVVYSQCAVSFAYTLFEFAD